MANTRGTKIRVTWVLLALAAIAMTSFAWGERGSDPHLLWQNGLVSVAVLFATFLLWPARVFYLRAAVALTSAAVVCGAMYLGTASFAWAFNECVAMGERVREDLSAYRKANGSFPLSLQQLASELPCRRFALPSLLNYQATASGYTLSFRDWLATHTASESQPFLASK